MTNSDTPLSTFPQKEWLNGRTRVYAVGSIPHMMFLSTFHADRDCPILSRQVTDRIVTLPLRFVVRYDMEPSEPCDHCTMDMEHTIDVAIRWDFVDPEDVVYS